jgi:hypothetical protein
MVQVQPGRQSFPYVAPANKDDAMKRPTAAERRHMARVADMPCLVCGSPATVHHVTSDGYKRITRSHMLVVPLCPVHHMIQHGPRESVEALGHAGFTKAYGIDLLAEAKRLAGDACIA